MDVLVTGSSGFLGTALLRALTDAGHRPIRAVRGSSAVRDDGVASEVVAWDPDAGTIDRGALEGIGGVVHLAGAGIADRRWTEARKRLILESRTRGTRLIAETLAALDSAPSVLVSASAIGYYGDRGDETLTEQSAPGSNDFLSDVCVQWEAATQPAVDAGVRVVTVRTGIVLGAGGGVLARMVLPFRLGLGGRIGSGRQWMSWIALDDEVRAILHALDRPGLRGPVNLTAPNPVTNAELTKTLGRVLHRPTVLPTPVPALDALYGRELVRHLLTGGQRVIPRALEDSGFTFRAPDLEGALRSELGR